MMRFTLLLFVALLGVSRTLGLWERVVPLRTVNKKLRERLAAQPAVPEDVKSEKPRKSRERKRSKRLKRQQPERKEKYRERQCRANRKQHHKLSKPSAKHDMQRQRSERL